MNNSLADYLIRLGDDELILAHRNSEWTGHAPILEEDIAFTNIALDELGHAMLWYSLAAELLDEDPDQFPDRLVFSRQPDEYRNVQLVELPKGDWAFSMLRQYLFDAAEGVHLNWLANSNHESLAAAAGKVGAEERYHLRHTGAWITRLANGTDESHRRVQEALDELYPLALQLFQPAQDDQELEATGLIPSTQTLQTEWTERVTAHLSALELPVVSQEHSGDRQDHTPHLADLITELQEVARLESGVTW